MESQKLVEIVFPNRISKISCENKFVLSNHYPKETELLRSVIDKLGQESAEAQSLSTIVTSFQKLRNSNHRCYVLICSDISGTRARVPLGLVKVGKKKLFLFNVFGECFEVEPICVLDFYIATGFQRRGYGKELFGFMLQEEQLEATDLPLDSPSPKMLAFMQKHYNQDHPLRQPNSFVVFPAFFQHVSQFLVHRRTSARSIVSSTALASFSIPHFPDYRSQRLTNGCSVSPKEDIIHGQPSTLSKADVLPQLIHKTSECSSFGTSSVQSSLSADKAILRPDINASSSEFGLLDQLRGTKAHSPQLGSRIDCTKLKHSPAIRYAKRLDVTSQSNLLQNRLGLSNSRIDNLLRRNERKANYDYQKAAWTNNRHTRLW